MTKNLLHITLRKYIVFSIAVVVVSVPIFYLLMNHLYVQETDDTMVLHWKEFNHQRPLKQNEIPLWNKYNRDVKIKPINGEEQTKFYTEMCYDSLDYELEPYRFYQTTVDIEGVKYCYTERKNLIETEDLLSNVLLLFIGIIVLLIVGFILLTNFISKSLWKSFYQTLNYIENFEVDKEEKIELTASKVAEFYRLNTSIKKLAEKNKIIYRNQREFVENAAHELQTPLAVFQAKLETLLQRDDLSEEQFKIIESLNKSIYDLTKLNKNLLLLSKIENDTFEDKKEIIVNELLKKRIPFFQEQAASKMIQLHYSESDPVHLKANIYLVEVVINNLILNAIQHTPESGIIELELTAHQFKIANTSRNSEALPQERLFMRFSKTSNEKSGNGLGLAIVKKICDTNKWDIRYQFEENKHVFIVTFIEYTQIDH